MGSILCRLGWHRSVFRDSAGFVGADRCNNCMAWIDREAGADVEAFRAAVARGSVKYDTDKHLNHHLYRGSGENVCVICDWAPKYQIAHMDAHTGHPEPFIAMQDPSDD